MKKLFLVLFVLIPFLSMSQVEKVTISGIVRDAKTKASLAYVNLRLKTIKDSSFVIGTITNEDGRFTLTDINPGNYLLEFSYVGYTLNAQPVLVGSLSKFLDLGAFDLSAGIAALDSVTVTAGSDGISAKMDKKTFSLANNITQAGGSVLQAMSNLPGVTLSQDGKLQLRGSDNVAVLIDGKQTALTGFDSQKGLDNIPASAIERIEIINNPSARYDANGNAGIINIIYKKSKQEGFNGKVSFTTGLGAIWKKQDNLPGIRPQYQRTPKVNPSLSLNYRKNKFNTFLQADWLYTETLNRNEFSTRYYDNGDVILQQVKRNRNTGYSTLRAGFDYNFNTQSSLTVSGLINQEKIIDRGDIPYFNKTVADRYRLWQFLEDEVKYTATATANYLRKFKQAGHQLNVGFNYTWHREDEKYYFTNILTNSTGTDSFKLLSDEHVYDLNVDYLRPLRQGRFEAGIKLRFRNIPINMMFQPGTNSQIDIDAGGWAEYKEVIPALYG
ncbi:MAG: TonB-dependent receptor, partial [Chitinophagaceae bacterium]|nr:TonB-dependent receptor [Chitinophagaceae bacterium]